MSDSDSDSDSDVVDILRPGKTRDEFVSECRTNPAARSMVKRYVRDKIAPTVKKTLANTGKYPSTQEGLEVMAEVLFALGSGHAVDFSLKIITDLKAYYRRVGHSDGHCGSSTCFYDFITSDRHPVEIIEDLISGKFQPVQDEHVGKALAGMSMFGTKAGEA